MNNEKLEKIKKNINNTNNSKNNDETFDTEVDILFDNETDIDFSNVDFSDVEELNNQSRPVTKTDDKNNKVGDNFESSQLESSENTQKQESPIENTPIDNTSSTNDNNLVSSIVSNNKDDQQVDNVRTQSNETRPTDLEPANNFTIKPPTDDQQKEPVPENNKQESGLEQNNQQPNQFNEKKDASDNSQTIEENLDNRMEDIEEILEATGDDTVTGRSRNSDSSTFQANNQPNAIVSKPKQGTRKVRDKSTNYKRKKSSGTSNVIPWIIFIILSVAIAVLAVYLYFSLNNVNPNRLFNSNNYQDLSNSEVTDSNIINNDLSLKGEENEESPLTDEITSTISIPAIREEVEEVINSNSFTSLGNSILEFELE